MSAGSAIADKVPGVEMPGNRAARLVSFTQIPRLENRLAPLAASTTPDPMFDTQTKQEHQDCNRIARRLVELHGPVRGATILAGAESVLNAVRTLTPSIQRPVMELLFDVFDEAYNEPMPTERRRSQGVTAEEWRSRFH